MEYCIQTTKENCEEIQEEIHALGVVIDQWGDGSINFEPYDESCLEELEEICEGHGITITVV